MMTEHIRAAWLLTPSCVNVENPSQIGNVQTTSTSLKWLVYQNEQLTGIDILVSFLLQNFNTHRNENTNRKVVTTKKNVKYNK